MDRDWVKEKVRSRAEITDGSVANSGTLVIETGLPVWRERGEEEVVDRSESRERNDSMFG